MALPSQLIQAREALEHHLGQFDWSGLTQGRLNILKAFLQVATAEGYGAVTMRSLGNALKIKAPSIYSHFPGGRDEIVTECLRWHYYNFGMAVLEAIKDADDAEHFLQALVNVHLSHQIQRPENNLWDILVASDRLGNFLQPEIRKEVNYWIALCASLYEAAASHYTASGTKHKSRVALSLIDSASSWTDWSGTQADFNRVTSDAVKLIKTVFQHG